MDTARADAAPSARWPAGPVVALDGPSGSGKSSVSRGVARALDLRYLDTGAMYRAVTWWMLERGIDIDDPRAIAAKVDEPRIEVGTDPTAPSVAVDGTDLAAAIRGPEVTRAVSAVSAVPEVRARLVRKQRDVVADGGIIVEGRDIGTVVLPDATVKVFLTASAEVRAARRHAELGAPGASGVATTGEDMARRDRLDSSRVASPMTQAEDADVVDSTNLTLDEVVAAIVALVHDRTAT